MFSSFFLVVNVRCLLPPPPPPPLPVNLALMTLLYGDLPGKSCSPYLKMCEVDSPAMCHKNLINILASGYELFLLYKTLITGIPHFTSPSHSMFLSVVVAKLVTVV